MKIEKIKISEIKKYKNNAKLHPQTQIDQIKKSMMEFGFNDPIAIDEDNMIIEGHGRLMAVEQLGFEEVEVIKLIHLTEIQKKQYIISHNKLNMNTGFDEEILKFELEEIKIEVEDIEILGFNEKELDYILDEDIDFEEMESGFEKEIESTSEEKVKKCPHCGEEI